MTQTNNKKGSALIITMIVMILCIAITGTLMLVSVSHNSQIRKATEYEKCYGILQAGIAQALMTFNARKGSNGDATIDQEEDYDEYFGIDGSPDSTLIPWRNFGDGRFKVVVNRPVDPVLNQPAIGSYVVNVFAELTKKNGTPTRRRAIATMVADGSTDAQTYTITIPGAPFYHAIYAGSSDVNGTNPLNLGGTGTKADRIQGYPPNSSNYLGSYPGWSDTLIQPGDVYCGKKLDIHQDAYIAPGAVARSGGVITETSSLVTGQAWNPGDPEPPSTSVKLQARQPVDNPIVPAYDAADIVYIRPSEFTKSINTPDDGRANVVNYTVFGDMINDPRSIFYMDPNGNPHNAAPSNNGTIVGNADTDRHDFYLDDLYHPGRASIAKINPGDSDREANYDGGGNYITVPPAGNDKIYYIDGNMWLHSPGGYSFQLRNQTDGSGTRITIVVKGNIYLSDNLLYQDLQKDAMALVAIKDARDYPDEMNYPSGSETREGSGDIRFGDPAYGTTYRFCAIMYAENDYHTYNTNNNLYVYGNMTAGNEVKISNGVGQNRKSLIIDYDARLQLDLINLPGLPTDPNSGSFTISKQLHMIYYKSGTFIVKAFYETGTGPQNEWN